MWGWRTNGGVFPGFCLARSFELNVGGRKEKKLKEEFSNWNRME